MPQIIYIDGRWYLIFSCAAATRSKARQACGPHEGGTYYLVVDAMLGPYHVLGRDRLVADEAGTLYSGKQIQDSADRWQFMAFKNVNAAGEFVGDISDPLPVEVLPDGLLQVRTANG